MDKSAVESQAFESPASLGKAVAKLKQRLPRCLKKQVAVIRHLAVSTKVMPNQSKERQRVRHTPINVEAIEAFYRRHDIIREAPGMKDTVIIRTAGIKEIK